MFLLKGYLDSMPKELFEAARIDGAGDFRTLVQIVLPLMAPGLSTVAVFSMLSAWNEFLLAMLYVQDDDLRTIPAGCSPSPEVLRPTTRCCSRRSRWSRFR